MKPWKLEDFEMKATKKMRIRRRIRVSINRVRVGTIAGLCVAVQNDQEVTCREDHYTIFITVKFQVSTRRLVRLVYTLEPRVGTDNT
jgi:hypothetical protein